MYSLTVRDHLMIAHSFNGELFGPAQQLHGATYVVDATFQRPELDADDLIVDIGLASDTLSQILQPLNFSNLDEMPEFKGRNTTTEFMARQIFERLRQAIRDGRLGPTGEGLTALRITLGESHVAWASYEGPLHD